MEATPQRKSIELPVREEPAYTRVQYAALPPAQRMVVTQDTDDLLDNVKRRFEDHTQSGRSNFQLSREELVVLSGVPYRRVWVTYTDESTWSPHGSCFQNVSVWLDQSGAIAEVFVTRMSCPI